MSDGFEIVERKQELSATSEMVISRQAQEVQAAMVIAKKFPRDEAQSYSRIVKACKRTALAERAVYTYPRGGTSVQGPSIRLAEVIAQNWGNLDFGVVELDQRGNESTVMAYAWDLETNTRQTKVFQVKHERHTRQGSTRLTDPRDVYEMVANQGARRVRACILGVVPGDIVEAAVAECEKTLSGNNKEPLSDRVRKMAVAFAEWNVTQADLEARLGHKLDVTTEHELARLRGIYQSIRDNMAGVEAYFPRTTEQSNGKSGTAYVAEKLKAKRTTPPAEDPPAQEPDAPTWQPVSDEPVTEKPTSTPPDPAAEPEKAAPLWTLADLANAQDGDWARTGGIVEKIESKGTAEKPFKVLHLWEGAAKRSFSVSDGTADGDIVGKRVELIWKAKAKAGRLYYNAENVQVEE